MERNKLSILLSFAAIWAAAAGYAAGSIVTVYVTGTVTSVSSEGGFSLDGSIMGGSFMAGYCIYDIDTPDQEPGEYLGTYPLISMSMNIGNYTFTHNPTSTEFPSFELFLSNYVYIIRSPEPRFDGTIYVNSSPKTYDDITWQWANLELMNLWTSSSEYFTTDALPSSFPELSVFDNRRAFEARFYDEGNGYFGIYGEVTGLKVVPEPATILLFGLGAMLLRKKRRVL